MHQVIAEEIDEYAHVNNTVYLQWLDRIAWAHSAALGMPLERCLELRCGMAVRHTRVDYLDAALLGDTLLLATWIVACDGRLRCARRFDILLRIMILAGSSTVPLYTSSVVRTEGRSTALCVFA